MVAADPLDGHHLAGGQGPLGGGQGVVGAFGHVARGDGSVGPFEPQTRAADGTGQRLGVEAPVGRVVVLAGALGAEGEGGHGGVGPVVGEAEGDGEPGPAVGAVDERVPVAAVTGVGQFSQAVVAHGQVGGQEGDGPGGVPAGHDAEAVLIEEAEGADLDPLDEGHGRGLGHQAGLEPVHGVSRSLDLGEDPLGVVAHQAGEPEVGGQPVHVGPEPHPLDDPPHPDAVAHPTGGGAEHRHDDSAAFRPRVTATSRCIRPKL